MGVELASFFFLLRAFSPTGFTTALATYPYIVLAGDLPVSFSGVGVREGAAALLLSPYAVPSGAAVDASLVWFLFAMLLPAALGALWLVAERVRSGMRKSDGVAPKVDSTWAPVAAPQITIPLSPESVAPSHAEWVKGSPQEVSECLASLPRHGLNVMFREWELLGVHFRCAPPLLSQRLEQFAFDGAEFLRVAHVVGESGHGFLRQPVGGGGVMGLQRHQHLIVFRAFQHAFQPNRRVHRSPLAVRVDDESVTRRAAAWCWR